MQAELLVLGSGASLGVPIVGCQCSVCCSASAYNKRLRPSVLLTINEKKILIDAGPDFRQQALKYHINHIDGLFMTHFHYDHSGGIDDLRVLSYCSKQAIPCILSEKSLEEFQQHYSYLFQGIGLVATVSDLFHFHVLDKEHGEDKFLNNIPFSYLSYHQQHTSVLGYRFGECAYVTDIRDYDESIFALLKGVKILFVSALREKPSPVHFSIEEAIEFSKKINPQKTYFTHIAHEIEHEAIQKKLPKGVFLAYDGLKIDFSLGEL